MIRLVGMDVDGTLTDGGIYMDAAGGEFKRFNVKDGAGIVSLLRSGVEVAFISGRRSGATDRRAQDLGVTRVINGTPDKLPDLTAIAAELGLDASEVAFIGDDVQDVSCMKWAGLGIAVADASAEALGAADWITPRDGGAGAIRDAADYIARINGRTNLRE
ncbi:MAG: HAD-IIIA family hydrolase [Synergistaceae bacterium]|jgi:3-deoxy-D-manno-octulosonate 8-phosphate phosphatase (KDO 8-P phosphatase)|nr:HAD-IIIA family hydrolase [Synergistaceae bacterium]